MTCNVLVDHLARLVTRDEIIRRARVRPTPLAGLDQLPSTVAKACLLSAFEEVFEPWTEVVDILETLLGRALSHAKETYPDAQTYLAGAYAKEPSSGPPEQTCGTGDVRSLAQQPPLRPTKLTCLTGLAGVGKSTLFRALQRVVGGPLQVNVNNDHERLKMQLVLYHKQEQQLAISDNLSSLLCQFSEYLVPKKANIRRLAQQLRQMVFLRGVSLIIFDEAQIGTLSSEANAMITRLLLQLRDIGVPVVAGMNYSLVQKLMRRPAEDRHRLLSDPLVLHPPRVEEFAKYLRELRAAVPQAFHRDLDLDEHAGWIHQKTAGLPRYACDLLGIAYECARRDKRQAIEMVDLKRASDGEAYFNYREEVEVIQAQLSDLTRPVHFRGRTKPDLWCPFFARGAGACVQRMIAEDKVKEIVLSSVSPSLANKVRQLDVQSSAKDRPTLEKANPSRSTVRPTAQDVARNLDLVLGRSRRR
jgi:nucleoside-triphosphatase THEP1